MLRIIIMAVLGAYVVLVATTPAMHEDLTPLEASWKQQIVNNGLESNDGLESTRIQIQSALKAGGKIAGIVPWRCFVKKQDLRCSGTILTDSYVLVKSSCMKAGSADRIEVHAGGSLGNNAEQVVPATVLNVANTPAGILILKLDKKLTLNRKVMSIKLINKVTDKVVGIVAGFRNNGENYQSEFYVAALYDSCGQGKLCGYAYGGNWPMLTNDMSKSTDFLDYFDRTSKKFYFVGVLDTHYGQNAATYYKVKDMIPWLQKNVPGISIESASFFRRPHFIADSNAQLDQHL